MELSVEMVSKVKAEFAELDNWYAIAMHASGSYANLWDWCYGDGTLTEGEFAKLVSLVMTQAYLRNHEIYGSVVTRTDVESQAFAVLAGEYGNCKMVRDFEYRPWRFAA